jgi:GxxExxY protein
VILTTENTENPQSVEDNEVTDKIIGCAIKVHTNLDPGLLESAYQACLYYELVKSSLSVEKEKPLPLVYEEVTLDCGYRILLKYSLILN